MLDKIKYRITILKNLSPFLKGVGKYFILLCSLSIIAMLTALLTPQIYRVFIDNVIIGGDIHLLIIVIAGYLGVFALNTAIAYINNYCSNRLTNITLLKLRMNILKGFLTIDFPEYDQKNTGDMKMRIHDDTNYILSFANVQTINYVISYILIIISALLLLNIKWSLALFSLIVIPLTLFLDHRISSKEELLVESNREDSQKMESWLYNSIHSWKEVKALNLQKHERRIFVRYLHIFANFFGKWIYYWVIRELIIPKIKNEFLFRFCLYFLGGLLIMNNELTIGALLIFIQYYELLSSNITNVSKADAELQSNRAFYDRLLEGLDTFASNKNHRKICEYIDNEIEFKNVSFKYPNTERAIFKNINIKIRKGERIAITGRSGEGKTTMAKFIMGMLSPDEGTVSFCNTSIEEINHNLLYKKIGFVMQENALFNMSIKENLLFGKRNATIAELDIACKKAYIYDFIQSLPDKYNTIIGERGVKLSGGQRQRLVLARLFLRDVDILIFDEATSALDQYSENIIHEAINSIGTDKTIIVIAHRQSSIALCDRIVVLDRGSITG